MVIVINSVIGGFSWVDLVWLAASTVRLQVFDYRCSITANCPITLSDYNCAEWLVKNEAADAPITFEEIVMVMIKQEIAMMYTKSHLKVWLISLDFLVLLRSNLPISFTRSIRFIVNIR